MALDLSKINPALVKAKNVATEQYVDSISQNLANSIVSATNSLEARDGLIDTYYSTTAPVSANYGDYWVNTSSSPYVVSRYEGVNSTSSGTLSWKPSNSAIAKSLQVGYQSAIDAAGSQAVADQALGTANGKTSTYYRGTVPTTNVKFGDTWVNTSDNNKLYVAASDGSNEIKAGKWELAQDAKGALLESKLYTDNALQNVNVQSDIDANNNAFAQSLGYPSYSAMQAAASQGNTIINGGLIRTNLIDTDTLVAKNVRANVSLSSPVIIGGSLNINNKFTVDGLGNTTIKSGNTGARMEIANDRIRVFDASGQLRVVLGRLS